jgi:hypothetical protein
MVQFALVWSLKLQIGQIDSIMNGHIILVKSTYKSLILVDSHLVSCVHPSIDKCFPSDLNISLVSQRHRASVNEKLTWLVWACKGPVGTGNAGLTPQSQACFGHIHQVCQGWASSQWLLTMTLMSWKVEGADELTYEFQHVVTYED